MLRRASEIPALLQQKSFVSSSTIEYTKHDNNSNVAPSSLTTNGVIMTTTVIKEYDQETGNKLINSFMILKEIGRGVHGKVKLAQDLETGELVAIKIVDKKNRRRQMGYSLLRGASQLQQKEQQQHVSKENEFKIRREISILEKCCHPNVVKLKQVIDDPTNRKIYMALEYTESGEIEWRDEYDQPVLSVSEARRIFRDIVSGLDYLHYQGIIHRDIKPANLLMSRNKIAKISDFGVSYYNVLLSQAYAKHNIEQDMLSKIDRELAETAGTPAFFAPELCCAGTTTTSTNGGKRPRISKAIDVWALGVTLYCFIFGQCPFIAATEFELFDTIPTQPLTFPASKEGEQEEIDDSLKDLLNKLLTKNPDDRCRLDQVKRHPWVTKDLKNPEEWISNTDPRHYITQEQQVIITKEFQQQVQQAQHVTTESVTMMDRLRQSIRKLSFSFGASSGGGGNNSSNNMSRRKSSISALNNSRPTSFQQQLTNRLSHPTISATTMSKQPSFSTSLLSHATTSVTPTVSLSTGHTFIFNSSSSPPNNTHIPTTTPPPRPTSALHPLRPISPSYLSDEEESDLDEEEEEEECQLKTSTSTATRPDISRRVSSASSSSGLGLTFGRYRGGGAAGMTPIEPSK